MVYILYSLIIGMARTSFKFTVIWIMMVEAGRLYRYMYHMGLAARKPVFGVSDKVRLKSTCSATETS